MGAPESTHQCLAGALARVPETSSAQHMSDVRFACALSTKNDADDAEAEVRRDLASALGGAEPDLLAVFATHHHGPALEDLGGRLQSALAARVVMGCTGESVIGSGREVEGQAGLSALAAVLPGTTVRPFEVSVVAGPDGAPLLVGGPEIEDPSRASILLLADPYTFPVDVFLTRMNDEFAGVPIVGGLASGGMGPGQNHLITARGLVEGGALGVVLEGDVEVCSVVSQGCRPVGKPWVVTACEKNLVKKLGGESPLEAFKATLMSLTSKEQELLRRQPFVGLAIDAKKSTFARGDFLVRGIIGQGPEGSLFVADHVRRGQTIQFLVRDAESAGEDLRLLMAAQGGGALAAGAGAHSAGALLFSCNGRGSHMFSVPDHDVTCVRDGLAPNVPVAGFFAAGEIGPVGGRNFLHGFTASVAVFRARKDKDG